MLLADHALSCCDLVTLCYGAGRGTALKVQKCNVYLTLLDANVSFERGGICSCLSALQSYPIYIQPKYIYIFFWGGGGVKIARFVRDVFHKYQPKEHTNVCSINIYYHSFFIVNTTFIFSKETVDQVTCIKI